MRRFRILSILAILIVAACYYFWPSPEDPEEVTKPPQPSTPPLSETTPTSTTLEDVIEIAEEILANLNEEVADYSGTLLTRERHSGKLGDEQRMQFKIRNRSTSHGTSVYLKFEAPDAAKGREVIWQQDQNDGDILVHEGGLKKLIGTLKLAPEGMLAMQGQKYPITEIGMVRLTEKLIEKGRKEASIGQAVVEVFEEQLVGDRSCTLYQVTNPSDNGRSDFHIARIFVDSERQIPLRYAAWMWPADGETSPTLEEEYTYLDVSCNVGLTDDDFDSKNPEYDYP